METTGAGPEQQPVSVVLHVVHGLVHELEVFADDEGALAVADVTDLTDPEVG